MSSSVSIATPSRPTSPPSARGPSRAHQRRQVEGGREPGLAVLEQVAEALVRLLRGAEAGELPHRPEPAAVHRRIHAAREREFPGIAEVALVVDRDRVGRDERIVLEPGDRGEELALAVRACGGTAPRARPPSRRASRDPRSSPCRRLYLPQPGRVIAPHGGWASPIPRRLAAPSIQHSTSTSALAFQSGGGRAPPPLRARASRASPRFRPRPGSNRITMRDCTTCADARATDPEG